MIRRFTIAVAVALIATVSFAQQNVPTPEQFLGYNIGERFTPLSYDGVNGHRPSVPSSEPGDTHGGYVSPLNIAALMLIAH